MVDSLCSDGYSHFTKTNHEIQIIYNVCMYTPSQIGYIFRVAVYEADGRTDMYISNPIGVISNGSISNKWIHEETDELAKRVALMEASSLRYHLENEFPLHQPAQ